MIAKTVTGAARLLNVSQPGLSRTIKHTENRLGFALFDRVSGRLVPTTEAQVLYKQIEQIHKKVEDLEFVVKRLERGEEIVFRISAQPSIGHEIVPRALGRLRQKFPELIVQFDIVSVEQVTPYLLHDEGEYCVSLFKESHPNISSTRLGHTPLVCVLPPEHSLCEKKSVRIQELKAERLVSFRSLTPHGALITEMYDEAKIHRNVSTYVRFAETACMFVRHGFGVAIVDGFTIDGEASAGLQVRPLVNTKSMPLYCHHNKYASKSIIADHFENELKYVLSKVHYYAPAKQD